MMHASAAASSLPGSFLPEAEDLAASSVNERVLDARESPRHFV